MLPAFMAPAAIEFHRLTDELAICHAYDAAVKADLFSTALATSAGAFLVDPISPAAEMLRVLGDGVEAAGIIISNENHIRASFEIAQRLSVAIYADPAAGIEGAVSFEQLPLGLDLETVPIPGAPHGEVALHCTRNNGTLIVGDAVINFGSHGFDLLPAKYCVNAKLMRKSLRKLLEYNFERMLFAHGTPICSKARDRLRSLLESAP